MSPAHSFSADSFADNGVAVFPGAVSGAQLDQFRSAVDDLVSNFDPEGVRTVFSTDDQSHARSDYFLTSGDKIRYFLEDGSVDANGAIVGDKRLALNKIGHAMHDIDPQMSTFSRASGFADAAAAVGMTSPRLLQSMIIFKNPEVGGEVNTHTDHTFLWTEPQSVIGFWVAADDATQENGCLWALPGGHTIPVKERFQRTAAGNATEMVILDDSPYPRDGWVPLEVEAGTLIALHGTLPHRSAPNLSQKSRLAFTLHCIDADAEYPQNNWLQRPDLPHVGF